MTSPRPTDLNFALPPGFVPAVRPVPAPAAPVRNAQAPATAVRKVQAPAAAVRKVQAPATAVRRIEPSPHRVVPPVPALRAVERPAAAPIIEIATPVLEAPEAPVADPKPRAPRKPRAVAPKAAAPTTTAPKTTAPKTTAPKAAAAKPAPRPRATSSVAEVVEHEAGRILEDAARTAADMLAAARSTAARLNAELAAEQEQRRREMEDAVADLADYLDALAHRLRNGGPLSVG